MAVNTHKHSHMHVYLFFSASPAGPAKLKTSVSLGFFVAICNSGVLLEPACLRDGKFPQFPPKTLWGAGTKNWQRHLRNLDDGQMVVLNSSLCDLITHLEMV